MVLPTQDTRTSEATEAVANEQEELPQCEPQEVPNVANVLAYEAAPESQANESEAVRMSEQTEPTTVIFTHNYSCPLAINKPSV